MSDSSVPPVPQMSRAHVAFEALKDYAEDLRSVTWLAPVSAEEMNHRDRWLAEEIDKIVDAALDEPAASPAPETPQERVRISGDA